MASPLLLLVFETEKSERKRSTLMIQEVAAENKGALCSAVSLCQFWSLFALVPAQQFCLLKVRVPKSGHHAQQGMGMRGLLIISSRAQMTIEIN